MSNKFEDNCEHNYISFSVTVTTNCRLDTKFDDLLCCSDEEESEFDYQADWNYDWADPSENDYKLIKLGTELLAWCCDEANQDKIVEGYASNDID